MADATTTMKPDKLAAYFRLLGYTGFGEGEANDISAGIAEYRRDNGIPSTTRTENVMRHIKDEVASDPEVVGRMQRMAQGEPSAYNTAVIQIGLQTRGVAIVANGEMNTQTKGALETIGQQAAATVTQQFNTSAKDPEVAMSQAYLRVLGYDGQNDKKDVGPVDGRFGPLTTAAIAQFANTNKISPDDPQGLDKTNAALKQQATTPDMLKRMEDMLKSADPEKSSQDVKAIQTILKDAGLNVDVNGKANSQTFAALYMQIARQPAAPAAETAQPVAPSPTLATAPTVDVHAEAQPTHVIEIPMAGDVTSGMVHDNPNTVTHLEAAPAADTAPESPAAAPALPPVVQAQINPVTPAAAAPESSAEKPWFGGQRVTDRGNTYIEGGNGGYEAVRPDRGQNACKFNCSAAPGYPFTPPQQQAPGILQGLSGLRVNGGNGQFGISLPGLSFQRHR